MTIDMVGGRYGRLVVVERAGSIGAAQHAAWRCVCDCGGETVVRGAYLRQGRIKSCGCRGKETEFQPVHTTKHGMSKSRAYRIWVGMHHRCADVTGEKAHLYAKKGITVCERWGDFDAFLADMGEPDEGMSIDRIDGNRGYEPANCRWATSKEQANNTTQNRRLTYNGKTQTVTQWAEEIGVKQNTLLYRIRRGWSLDRALA